MQYVKKCLDFKKTTWLQIFLAVNISLFVLGITQLQRSPGRDGTAAIEEQHVEIARVRSEQVRKRSLMSSAESLDVKKEECKCPKQSKVTCPKQVEQNPVIAPLPNKSLSVRKEESSQKQKIGDDFDHSKKYQVPNIVHYIWYNTQPAPFQFHHMISVMSASKFIQPDVIYFHTDNEPTGEFWEKTKLVPKLKINKREPPFTLFGEKVKEPQFYTSHSNVDRLKVLMDYGGIYLDFDVFVTSSFDELREHTCTIGLESDKKACGSVIVCSKEAFFLQMWINSYLDNYQMDEWAYNTGQVPFNLAKRFPHLVNVEKTRLNRPNFLELDFLWGNKTFEWRKNYAVHTWYRLWKTWSGMFRGVEPDPQNIKTLNNTFGQIARTVIYGSPGFVK